MQFTAGELMLPFLYTSIVCWCIKLNAVAMQQKCFGEYLGDRVWIRSFVGVNSLSIRVQYSIDYPPMVHSPSLPQAIKLILEKPGLTLQKVSILCGGPDWPTSVLTGILRLKLSQMLLGSVPIFFLIAPCVLAGGFQNLLPSPGETGTTKEEDAQSATFASLATISLLFATLTQSGALLIAMYYIEQVRPQQWTYGTTMQQ
jgi:hypothetical protein